MVGFKGFAMRASFYGQMMETTQSDGAMYALKVGKLMALLEIQWVK
jgi:hypothetical protein